MPNLTREGIVELLKSSDKAIARALVVLTERQTTEEQTVEETIVHNGRGFRPCHAKMGTSISKFYLSRGFITAKQANYWRKKDRTGRMRIEIYSRQLLEIAEQKAAKKVSETAFNYGHNV